MVCIFPGTGIILFAEKPVIVPFSVGRDGVNQGEFVQLTCVVTKGDRPLTITWSLKGDIVSSDPTLTTTMLGTQASMLVISSVDYHHSGVYTCRAENPAGVSIYSTEIKVNGNFLDCHWIYFIYRETCHCSFFLWEQCCQSRRLCSTDLCHHQRGQTIVHHMES